jgi:hypothetical protein
MIRSHKSPDAFSRNLKDGKFLARFLNEDQTEIGFVIERAVTQLAALTADSSPAPEAIEQFNADHMRPHTFHLELIGLNQKRIPVFVEFPTGTTSDEMMIVIRLAREQLLDRLRRCDWCGIWFFAPKVWARFCSTQCQQEQFRSAPDFKKRNKKYQRDWFRKQASKNRELYRKDLTPKQVREFKRKHKEKRHGKKR